MQWYCPKCGQPTVEKNEVWTCSSGGLEFSKHLGGLLAATYCASFIPGRKPVPPMQLATLFCPSCCTPVDREAICPECHRSLQPFMHELVEFHPHADGHGKYL
jgi:hypothetical protein